MAKVVTFGELMLRLAPPGLSAFHAGGYLYRYLWRR